MFWYDNVVYIIVMDGTYVGIDDDAKKIVTTEGSYAQEYAKKHNIPCEIVDHIEMPEE